MTASVRSGAAAKPRAVNPKLLILLGVIVVLALGLRLVPSLLGGGGGVAPFRPSTALHLHKALTAPAGSGSGSSGAATSRPARDPFAPPPGFAPH